ncbi:MAG TPA: hypothetical protein VG099_14815, partial [Gemmataceae bacterium]|nr:hypothetical protein [Gemmataceae bacterium]
MQQVKGGNQKAKKHSAAQLLNENDPHVNPRAGIIAGRRDTKVAKIFHTFAPEVTDAVPISRHEPVH